MGKDWKESENSMLPAKEIEKLLLKKYGDKLKPIDNTKLAKQRQQRAKYREKIRIKEKDKEIHITP